MDAHGECWWAAEIHRLKGELWLQASSRTPQARARREAEACFRRALAIAHRQGAKLLELRAVVSLSRLWQHQGKAGEARQLLAARYNWFTEGFDTADLKDAKTLLQALRH
jgi:adenylate cyclase